MKKELLRIALGFGAFALLATLAGCSPTPADEAQALGDCKVTAEEVENLPAGVVLANIETGLPGTEDVLETTRLTFTSSNGELEQLAEKSESLKVTATSYISSMYEVTVKGETFTETFAETEPDSSDIDVVNAGSKGLNPLTVDVPDTTQEGSYAPRTIESVITFVADQRGVTPEEVQVKPLSRVVPTTDYKLTAHVLASDVGACSWTDITVLDTSNDIAPASKG